MTQVKFLAFFIYFINLQCAVYGACRLGFIHFKEKCYFFSHQEETWFDSQMVCRVFGGKLAEPRTMGEAEFIRTHSRGLGGEFWIGIEDIIDEDSWEFASDGLKLPINSWSPGEPNQHTGANCGILWSHSNGHWADNKCEDKYKFVCQIDYEVDPEIVG